MKTLRDLVGHKVVAAQESHWGVFLKFDDDTELQVGQGDSGTMRNPEPYFYATVTSGEECRERDVKAAYLRDTAAAEKAEAERSKDEFREKLEKLKPVGGWKK